jgi:uncharacterized protein YdeI (YjbR/CyaY-like superfamily)
VTPTKRPRHAMPTDVNGQLESNHVLAAYRQRPPYQRNDYLGWIIAAKTPETRRRRIDQTIEELKRGNVYMKMAWPPGERA